MESCLPTSFAPSLDDSLRQINEVAEARGVVDYISATDAVSLRKYFGTRGMSALHKSTAGADLDRAELYANPTVPCTRCGGDKAKYTGGTGWMPSSLAWTCPGYTERAIMGWLQRNISALPPAADTPCTACKGLGWVRRKGARNWRELRIFWVSSRYVNGVRHPLRWTGPYTIAEAEEEFRRLSVTLIHDVCIAKGKPADDDAARNINAFPTGSSVERSVGSSAQVSDTGMQRIAVVGRRLDIMERMWALSVDVLDSYYGPEDSGLLVSVWPLTAAGKTLLRANARDVPTLAFFANERNDQTEKQDQRRAALFAAADQQASALLRGARQLWNIVCRDTADQRLGADAAEA